MVILVLSMKFHYAAELNSDRRERPWLLHPGWLSCVALAACSLSHAQLP